MRSLPILFLLSWVGAREGEGAACELGKTPLYGRGPRVLEVIEGGSPLSNVDAPWSDLTLASISGEDDAMVFGLPLGFQMPFYEEQVDSVSISTNGFVTFDTENPFDEFLHLSIPTHNLPELSIAVLWDDLLSSGGGGADLDDASGVWYGQIGDSFVVLWSRMKHLLSSEDNDAITFELALHPSGEFTMTYLVLDAYQPLDLGGNSGAQLDDEHGVKYCGSDGYCSANELTSGKQIRVSYECPNASNAPKVPWWIILAGVLAGTVLTGACCTYAWRRSRRVACTGAPPKGNEAGLQYGARQAPKAGLLQGRRAWRAGWLGGTTNLEESGSGAPTEFSFRSSQRLDEDDEAALRAACMELEFMVAEGSKGERRRLVMGRGSLATLQDEELGIEENDEEDDDAEEVIGAEEVAAAALTPRDRELNAAEEGVVDAEGQPQGAVPRGFSHVSSTDAEAAVEHQ
ncbi:unnamed protein product [Chrysoparadoxa australica]